MFSNLPPVPDPGKGPDPGPTCPSLGHCPPTSTPTASTSTEEGDVVIFYGARGLPRLEIHHFLGMRL